MQPVRAAHLVQEVLIINAGCTQKELAETLRVTPASIALSTKRLQKSGYVEKRVNESNRRCNRLYATPAGEAAALRHRQYLDEANEKTFAGISEEEQAVLCGLYDRMIQNLNEDALPLYPLHWKETNKC